MDNIQTKGKSNFSYLKFLAKKNETDIHPKGEAATDLLIRKLEIKDGQNVLEVGFGSGKTLIRLASAFNINLYGVDVMPKMFSNAEKRISNAGLKSKIKIYLTEDKKFPFPDDFFDIVFAESVLGFQDKDDLDLLIDKIKRVLKPAGKFAANDAVWKKELNKEIVEKINIQCLKDFGMRPATQDYWDYEDWKNFYSRNGFDVVSAELILNKNNEEINGIRKNSALKYINPFAVLQDLNYRNKIRKHRKDKDYVETRLFLMRKGLSPDPFPKERGGF